MDDTKVYRPGLQAIREAGVHSPLIDCGLTKADIRKFAADAGLSTAGFPMIRPLIMNCSTGFTGEKYG